MAAFLRQYGVGTNQDVIIPMIKAGEINFAVSADWTPATGDVKVSQDGGAAANINTLPTFITNIGWKFVFTATELQCRDLTVTITDSATKAVEDQNFTVSTYGNASARFQSDFDALVESGDLPSNFSSLGIESDGDLTKVNTLHGHTAQTGDTFAIANSGTHGNAALKTLIDDVPTTAEFEARTLVAASYFDPAADTVATVTTVTNMRGTDSAALASTLGTPADTDIATDIANVKAKSDLIPADFTTKWGNVYDHQITGITAAVVAAAGKHSAAAVTMISTNSSLSGGTLTAKSPIDDSTFNTYTVTSDSGADNITGVE